MWTIRWVALAGVLVGGMGALGYAVAGGAGMFAGLGLSSGAVALARRHGNRWLARWLGARPGEDDASAGRLKILAAELSRRAGIRVPELWLVESPQINAFALDVSGRPLLCVTTGALRFLTPPQEEALLAFQIARLRNGAAREAAWGALVAGMLSRLAGLGLASRADIDANPLGLPLSAAVAPVAATLTRLSQSPSRAQDAHADAAVLVGGVEPLRRALERAEFTSHARPLEVPAALSVTAAVNPHLGAPASSLTRLYGRGTPVAYRFERIKEREENRRGLSKLVTVPEAA